MSSRVADEREQRRGLILGLTLAEVLLLLLFLLLLALASQLKFWKGTAETAELKFIELSRTLEQLKPLQEALMRGGAFDITSVQELVVRLQRLQEVELEVSRLRQENSVLVQESALVKELGLKSEEKQRILAAVMKRAVQIDPDDPPALLKRALDIVDRLGASTQPEQVRPLSEMMNDAKLREKFAMLQKDNEKIRGERDNLMRSGSGLTYPSCWRSASSATEYIFDITFTDAGVRVVDATPGRANDAAWSMVGPFVRGSELNERVFLTATRKLFDWSVQQQCRFYTINRDETGDGNKGRYKDVRTAIESQFYPSNRSSVSSSQKKGGSKGSAAISIVPQTNAVQPESAPTPPSGGLFWSQ